MAKPGGLAASARRNNSVATLRRLRDELAVQLDAQIIQHVDGCACTCGPPAGDPRQIAALSRALADVLERIDRRVPPKPVAKPTESTTVDDELKRRRNALRSG
jgi:hypothetical protein